MFMSFLITLTWSADVLILLIFLKPEFCIQDIFVE